MATTVTITSAVTQVIGWIPETLSMYLTSPAVYFIAMALAAGVFSLTRRLVPMKRR